MNDSKKPIMIAHRGFRVGVVENTCQAFDKAVEMEMDYMEIDVHLSSDGKLVVIHDETVDRVFAGSGDVVALSFDELSKFKSKDGEQSIPLLENVLSGYQGKIKFMIELKGDETGVPAAQLVKEKNMVDQVVFSSRSIVNLEGAMKGLSPDPAKLCLNITKCEDFPTKQLLKANSAKELPLPFQMISLRSTLVGKDYIEKCHDLSIIALCWDFLSTKKPMKVAKKLLKMGIDGYLFDDPEMVLDFKKEI
ncbi:MAG: glycerophosphodiester phosphodiesterase [Candidatus Hodarchaeota archaeon]